jgi:hypothetical protein
LGLQRSLDLNFHFTCLWVEGCTGIHSAGDGSDRRLPHALKPTTFYAGPGWSVPHKGPKAPAKPPIVVTSLFTARVDRLHAKG